MSQIDRKYDFVPGTKIYSSQVDEELAQLVQANNTLDVEVKANELDIETKVTNILASLNPALVSLASIISEVARHIISSDHDGRYYTETEIDAKLQGIVVGQIPANSLTEASMANDMKKQSGGVAPFDTVATLSARAPGPFLTTNSGNDYTTIGALTLTTGMILPVKFNADSTGAVTLNTKSIKNPDGTAWTEAKSTGQYTLNYDGTDFFVPSSGLSEFFGDGSDGTIPNLNAITTAPNVGTVANLWDMNAGTTFTTGSLASGSDQVVFSIDFGSAQNIRHMRFYQATLSTGTSRNLDVQWSDDGSTNWTSNGTATAVSTTPTDITSGSGYSVKRYWRVVLKAGGSACTVAFQGVTINYNADSTISDTQTTKVWNIIVPTTAQSGVAIKQYTSLTLQAGYEITTDNPCQGLILYSQSDATISGTIDMSKKAGLAPNGNVIPMLLTKKAYKTAKTSSLMHFNNNITDDNGRTWTNNGGATFDATNKKFGSHAISFNGTNQWIDTPASDDFSFGVEDFTIDCWIRPTSLASIQTIYQNDDGVGNDYQVQIKLSATTGYLSADFFNNLRTNIASVNSYYAPAGALSLAINTWYHVAVVNKDGLVMLFLNGTLLDSTRLKGTIMPSKIARLGASLGSAYYFAGQIDEFRIIKGKAMYTANFTPPVAEYTYTATYTDTPNTIDMFYKLSTVLQGVRGGYGGNGGYGGGYSGSTGRQSSVGIGGAGRLNLGGFGGGGSGGAAGPTAGGIGGSIEFAELGGGSLPNTDAQVDNTGLQRGVCGCGARGNRPVAVSSGAIGKCLGGGTGGTGACQASNGAGTSDSQYSGGNIMLIAKGSITINSGGFIKANGGNGSNGSAANGTNAGGGGSGGGSGGGVVSLFYKISLANSGTIQVNGGNAGTGGAGIGTGEAGGAGTSGSVGVILTQQL